MKLTEITQTEYGDVQKNETAVSIADKKAVNQILQMYEEYIAFVHEEKTREENSILSDGYCFLTAREIIRDAIKNTDKKKQANRTEYTTTAEYTSKDITEFSTLLKKYQTMNAFSYSGFFISALINDHFAQTKQTEPYVLILEPYNETLDYLCYKNEGATVHIYGNVGNETCSYMLNGEIIISGNSEDDLGAEMINGLIHLQGNANGSVGLKMRNGMIQIDGSVSSSVLGVGYEMSGGKIIVNRDVHDTAAKMKGGEIIIKRNVLGQAAEYLSSGILRIEKDCKQIGVGMRGGKVYIKGNVEEIGDSHCGNSPEDMGHYPRMTGGTIHFEGEYKRMSKLISGTEIFQRGKRIFPVGKK